MTRNIIFGLLFFCLAAVLTAQCQCQKKVTVQVTGKVRLVGSDSFSELVISSEDKQWYIASDEIKKLKDLQQRIVTVEGEETIKEMKWASGGSAGTRIYLSNIRIVTVE